MAYDYEQQRAELFTDDGQRMLLRVRDRVKVLLKLAGAFKMGAAMSAAGSGDSWTMMACVDRLVELGEIRRVTPVGTCAGQDEVFVSDKANNED